MIAHYGYADGSGEYFIIIDTGPCASCRDHACLCACPAGILEPELDEWDDEVAVVSDKARKRLREECAGCKPAGLTEDPPCVRACSFGAIRHSW